ncbi:hypothetical protein NEOLEDRAFT_775129 [Neolentinus lepideus HHB14362 ss-1]|uniref:F-box domain-containing protein n=1 Tax=Neolentinus lepideus HHB14362 ss-1 TaxID=1314782 RepID=A0A165UV51_9AGAM|nr:hypothetical protein NEOLEDRAFT_775129 [Neolentinus lepideus HHB14362 ss-1]
MKKTRKTLHNLVKVNQGSVGDEVTAKLPPAKRARKNAQEDDAKTVKKTRRKTGKLSVLLEMPLDVLFEIFGLLLPLDLLRLSWTSSEFRCTLMQRSARSLWIQALKHVERLPECLEDLTEPQWAFLAFYPCCHHCGAQNCQTIIWSCRMRCCNKCLKTQLVTI